MDAGFTNSEKPSGNRRHGKGPGAIVVRLQGGLGNQLYQFAAGYALHLRSGMPLLFDEASLAQDAQRRLVLHRVTSVPIEMASCEDVRYLTDIPFARLRRSLAYRLGLERPVSRYHAREVSLDYRPLPDPGVPGIYLDGYWQSYRYFEDAADQVRQAVPPIPIRSEIGMASRDNLNSRSFAALHVRRGDYAAVASATQLHGVLPESYYRRAISLLRAAHPSIRIAVVSDDPDWCTQHLALGSDDVIIRGDGPDRDLEEFQLMRECRHFVIANSSFSWWAAWLGAAPESVVIAPDPWFAGAVSRIADRFPSSWTTISSELTDV